MITDLKYAFRTLWKRPGFTIVAIITLALGIGTSTAIFSVLEAVLLRPFPYPHQERIVEVREFTENGRGMRFTEPNFFDLKGQSRSFEALAQYSAFPSAVAGGSEPVRTNVASASEEFFRVLGVSPVVGRVFGASAGTADRQVVVVSYGFWKRLLGGRRDLEGMSLRMVDRSFSVIGVLPPDAGLPPDTDVWFPQEIFPPNLSRTSHNSYVVGRLKADVKPEQAAAEVTAIGRQLKEKHGTETDAYSFGITPLRERYVKDIRGVLAVLSAAVGLLLVIACSNVANLLLVRANARRKEVALRATLGASRAQLARQFIAESLLLTLVSGAAGVLVAFWSVDLIVRLYSGNLPRVGAVGVNNIVLLFALALSLLLGVILGLVPAFHNSHRQLQADLQEAGRGQSTSGAGTRVRNFLIVAQVALTLLLLVGAGLLGRSFQRLLEVRPGFEPENAVAMTVVRSFTDDAGAGRRNAQLYQDLIARLATLPGVLEVGGINALPMSGAGANGTFLIQEGGAPAKTVPELIEQLSAFRAAGRTSDADFRVASGGYFAAMKIPLRQGRVFRESDGPDAPHVAVISESLAQKYWPNGDALGRQIQFGNMDGDLHLLNVIGIAADVHDQALNVEARPTVYVHYLQRPLSAYEFSVVLRAQGDSASLIAAMRREAQALDPEMPTKFRRVEELVAASLDNRRFSMVMLAMFAGAALLLAMVGLYGVMAYITAQRTQEIGIRMALGAQRIDIVRMIFRQSFTLVIAGVVLGILGSVALTRLLGSMLYGVQATDLTTYAAVVGVLIVAAALASFIPARRAMKVDPMVALRYE